MSDATRKVTIILDVKAGEMPDMSWVTTAKNEMAVLTKESNSLVDQTKAMKAESENLVKTQTEAIKAETELLKLKDDGNKAAIDGIAEQASARTADVDRAKRDAKEYFEWHQRTQAEYRAKEEQQAKEAAERQRQIKEQAAVVTGVEQQPFVVPTPNPNLPLSEDGVTADRAAYREQQRQQQIERNARAAEDARRQREEQFDAELDRRFQEREAKEEQQRQQQLERDKKAAQDRLEAAQQAEESLPKHWRNTLLNAGQATASVARYVSHMRMLKSVAGDSLEDVAKKFMTVQSRVEMIAASTSAFTNFGTMLDGMQQVGKATEQVVAQQIAMGKAVSMNQSFIMSMGRAAADIAPLVAPAQIAFTTLTGLVVGLDIAMDLMGDSAQTAREKQESMLKLFDQQLDKVMRKLNEETKIIQQQNDLLQVQWNIRELLTGDTGLGANELGQQNADMRAQKDAEAEQKLRQETEKMFADKMTDGQKARQAEIDKQKKDLESRISISDAWIESGNADAGIIQQREDLDRRQKELADRQRQLDHETGKFNRDELQGADIQNGQIQNFDKFMQHAQNLPENERKSFLGLTGDILAGNNNEIIQQQRDTQNRAKQAEQKAIQEAAEIERQQREMDMERAMAERYSMADSQWRVDEAQLEMQRFQNAATPELREEAARAATQLLQGGNGQPDLMTQEMEAELGLGAAARPDLVMSMMQDAATFGPDEEDQYTKAIEEHNAAQVEARDQAKAMGELATSLKKILEENNKQIQELRRAIENRDN